MRPKDAIRFSQEAAELFSFARSGASARDIVLLAKARETATNAIIGIMPRLTDMAGSAAQSDLALGLRRPDFEALPIKPLLDILERAGGICEMAENGNSGVAVHESRTLISHTLMQLRKAAPIEQ